MTYPTLDINGRAYNPDLSPFYNTNTFPVPATESGRFILPANAVRKKGDTYSIGVHAPWRQDAYWLGSTCVEVVQNSLSIVCYSRAIAADPELYNRMEAYKTSGIPMPTPTAPNPPTSLLDTELAAAEAEVERLRKAVGERDAIKVGDWVVCTDSGASVGLDVGSIDQVARIENVVGVQKAFYLKRDSEVWYYSRRFRKATDVEVAAHLAKQDVYVTVANKAYKAEYRKGYVSFGCANIDNALIHAAHVLFTTNRGAPMANRKVESVRIGKGDFTADIVAKLHPNLVD